VQPSGLRTLFSEAGNFFSTPTGRIGRSTKLPPQFGHTLFNISLAHWAQNVHSKVQIRASGLSGGKSTSQHSQLGRSSSIWCFQFFRAYYAKFNRNKFRRVDISSNNLRSGRISVFVL